MCFSIKEIKIDIFKTCVVETDIIKFGRILARTDSVEFWLGRLGQILTGLTRRNSTWVNMVKLVEFW